MVGTPNPFLSHGDQTILNFTIGGVNHSQMVVYHGLPNVINHPWLVLMVVYDIVLPTEPTKAHGCCHWAPLR